MPASQSQPVVTIEVKRELDIGDDALTTVKGAGNSESGRSRGQATIVDVDADADGDVDADVDEFVYREGYGFDMRGVELMTQPRYETSQESN